MEKQSVKAESSSDSTSEDSDSDRELKSEFVKSEPQYSPGGGGDSPNESYTPAKPKKEKPYRPGGFFFDDDEEEEDGEDNEMDGFIQGDEDEEEEEEDNPFFNSGTELRIHRNFPCLLNINGSVLKNPEISGAIFTLNLSILILNSQCVEGARDFRVL